MRTAKLFFLLLILGALGACSFSNDTTPPEISSTTPAADAVDVDIFTDISATFNEDIFANSLDNNSLTISANGQPITGSLGFDAFTNTLTLVTERVLPLAANITATVSNAITDLAGNAFSGASWSFTTVDGQWQPATLPFLDTEDLNAFPSAAFAPDGTAIATWTQDDGFALSIFARHYVPGLGWGEPGVIEILPLFDALASRVVINSTGHAVVAWVQYNDTDANTNRLLDVWANIYSPEDGWGTPEKIDSEDLGHVFTVPAVAIDNAGNIIVAWTQFNGPFGDFPATTTINLWANRYTPADGWGTAEMLETNPNFVALATPGLAMNGAGNAIITWSQSDGTRMNAFARHFTPAGGWEPQIPLETSDNGIADNSLTGEVRVAMNADGQAVAAWSQADEDAPTVIKPHASRYTPGTGWSTAELIETHDDEANPITTNAGTPRIAMNPAGDAIALWLLPKALMPSGTRNAVRANYYTAGVGWGESAFIESNDAGAAIAPTVAMDVSGNALAVWAHNDGGGIASAWGARFRANGGWQTPELLEEDDTGNASGINVALVPDGSALAYWQQVTGPNPEDIQIFTAWFGYVAP